MLNKRAYTLIADCYSSEASVTIPNIVYVVDSGFVKLRAINPTTGFESLMVVETSRASAMQRAGE